VAERHDINVNPIVIDSLLIAVILKGNGREVGFLRVYGKLDSGKKIALRSFTFAGNVGQFAFTKINNFCFIEHILLTL
jgi:hypothetical protein